MIVCMVFFFTQKMNKSDVYRKRTRRPMSTSVIQSKVDSKSLIGQTLRVQDWLNEKTVKGLQVMYRKLAKETSYQYKLVAWFQYEVDIIYLFINIYRNITKFINHPSMILLYIYIYLKKMKKNIVDFFSFYYDRGKIVACLKCIELHVFAR